MTTRKISKIKINIYSPIDRKYVSITPDAPRKIDIFPTYRSHITMSKTTAYNTYNIRVTGEDVTVSYNPEKVDVENWQPTTTAYLLKQFPQAILFDTEGTPDNDGLGKQHCVGNCDTCVHSIHRRLHQLGKGCLIRYNYEYIYGALPAPL